MFEGEIIMGLKLESVFYEMQSRELPQAIARYCETAMYYVKRKALKHDLSCV